MLSCIDSMFSMRSSLLFITDFNSELAACMTRCNTEHPAVSPVPMLGGEQQRCAKTSAPPRTLRNPFSIPRQSPCCEELGQSMCRGASPPCVAACHASLSPPVPPAAYRHGLHCVHGVLHGLHRKVGLLNVVLLVVQLVPLAFVQSLLLEDLRGSHGVQVWSGEREIPSHEYHAPTSCSPHRVRGPTGVHTNPSAQSAQAPHRERTTLGSLLRGTRPRLLDRLSMLQQLGIQFPNLLIQAAQPARDGELEHRLLTVM